MARIEPVQRNTADTNTAELLQSVEKNMGKVINILGTMAHSPAVLKAFLGFSQSLSEGSLPLPLRERIALAIGEATWVRLLCCCSHGPGSKSRTDQ